MGARKSSNPHGDGATPGIFLERVSAEYGDLGAYSLTLAIWFLN